MTSEMSFDCLLVSRDPAAVCIIDAMLQDLSICTSVCADPAKAADILQQVSTDLIVIDLENHNSIALLNLICGLQDRQKPTVVGISTTDEAVSGVHLLLHRPITQASGLKSLQRAYSRMLQDFRKHTRFALMMSLFATNERDQTVPIIVTNIGRGGLGFTTKQKIECGSILSMQIPLPGIGSAIGVRARVLWTRDYGAAGCEFVHLSRFDEKLLHEWLESKYRIKKPSIPIEM